MASNQKSSRKQVLSRESWVIHMVPLTLQRDYDAWTRCAILLGQARQSQEQTIWIQSKAAVPTLSTWEAGDLLPFPCAASTTDTFIHIHIPCQQHGVPLTQRRWQVI